MSVTLAPRLHLPSHGLRARVRVLLAAHELFVGVGALFGGYNLMADAEGFGVERSWLEGTPFPDYTIPGLVLFVVIGGGMLVAAALALVGSRYAALAALVIGVTLIGFVAVETLLIGYQGSQQIRLLVVVGVPALVMVAIGWRAVRGSAKESGGA
jgi:hypothetical protein